MKPGRLKPVYISDDKESDQEREREGRERENLRNNMSIATIADDKKGAEVAVISRATNPADHDSQLLIQTRRIGNCSIEKHQKLCCIHSTFVRNDVVNVTSDESLYILM